MTAAFAPAQLPTLPLPSVSHRHLASVPIGPPGEVLETEQARIAGGRAVVVPAMSVVRRRQVVALAVAICMAWLLIQAAATVSTLFGPALVPASTGESVVHVVQPGESLWSIARAHQPAGDIRGFVDQLAMDRGGPDVVPGETIVISQ